MPTDDHAATRLLAHLAIGAPVGVAFADRLEAIVLSMLASVLVGIMLELLRPWLQRRADRLARSTPPPPAPGVAPVRLPPPPNVPDLPGDGD